MLPYKFKSRKCEEISFRNAAPHSMSFYLRVHIDLGDESPLNDLGLSINYFDSEPTEHSTLVSLSISLPDIDQ